MEFQWFFTQFKQQGTVPDLKNLVKLYDAFYDSGRLQSRLRKNDYATKVAEVVCIQVSFEPSSSFRFSYVSSVLEFVRWLSLCDPSFFLHNSEVILSNLRANLSFTSPHDYEVVSQNDYDVVVCHGMSQHVFRCSLSGLLRIFGGHVSYLGEVIRLRLSVNREVERVIPRNEVRRCDPEVDLLADLVEKINIDTYTCKVCLTNGINTTLKTCKHVFCGSCVSKMNTCAICRKEYQKSDILKMFL